jgi:uncharacterized protein YdcH (DUF465 family)
MPMITPEVRQSLLVMDPEFRRLAEEHNNCETQLEQILKSFYLSSEDLIQESNLKKMKLRLKDRMEMIAARHLHHVTH